MKLVSFAGSRDKNSLIPLTSGSHSFKFYLQLSAVASKDPHTAMKVRQVIQ